MTIFFGYLSIALLIAVIAIGIAMVVISGKFFTKLIAAYPELANSLAPKSKFVVGEVSQPLPSSRMKYLKERRYKTLHDADLRKTGAVSWRLLVAYAATFTCMIISALVWEYLRNNAP